MSNGENENLDNTENKEIANEAENTTTTAPETESAQTENALSKFLSLKDSNPKVFFGAIGGVVVLLLVLVFGTGSSPEVPKHQAVPVVVGENYILKGANTTAPEATIRLVSVPGSMAAYDDTEEEDRVGGCKHMPQGTRVKVTQIQGAFGKPDAFAQVEILEGECTGQKGWVLSINLGK